MIRLPLQIRRDPRVRKCCQTDPHSSLLYHISRHLNHGKVTQGAKQSFKVKLFREKLENCASWWQWYCLKVMLFFFNHGVLDQSVGKPWNDPRRQSIEHFQSSKNVILSQFMVQCSPGFLRHFQLRSQNLTGPKAELGKSHFWGVTSVTQLLYRADGVDVAPEI